MFLLLNNNGLQNLNEIKLLNMTAVMEVEILYKFVAYVENKTTSHLK
jgi:hypothetical protein